MPEMRWTWERLVRPVSCAGSGPPTGSTSATGQRSCGSCRPRCTPRRTAPGRTRLHHGGVGETKKRKHLEREISIPHGCGSAPGYAGILQGMSRSSWPMTPKFWAPRLSPRFAESGAFISPKRTPLFKPFELSLSHLKRKMIATVSSIF